MIIPGALPQALVGLRQSLGVAWLSLIVAETVSADAGLGYLINDAREFLKTDVIVVGLAVYSLLGLLTDTLVRSSKGRRWHGAHDQNRGSRDHPPDPHHPRPTSQSVATVTELHRSFGTTHVLRGLDLEIRRGEFVALLGRSGSGKSTLLRSLAGLDPTSSARARRAGRGLGGLPGAAAASVAQGPGQRRPRAGQRSRARSAAGARAHALDEVGLEEKPDAWPLSLSGGQAQRVSLARALVSEPDLLLLDEPFSSLDALTRIEMHRLVIALWERHRPGVLLVTHDVDEALALADRVLVLDDGKVAAQWSVDRAARRAHR